MAFGGNGEGCVDLFHVPFQVLRHDGVNVYNDDTDFSGADVLLMHEVGIQGNEHSELSFGHCKEPVIVVVSPALVLDGYHFVLFWKLGAEPVGNVMVEKKPHAGTCRPRSSSSLNRSR